MPMPKKKPPVKVIKCECSRCGQVSHVEPHTSHVFCRGFRIHKPLPALFASLQGKHKGSWIPVEETANTYLTGMGMLLKLASEHSMTLDPETLKVEEIQA